MADSLSQLRYGAKHWTPAFWRPVSLCDLLLGRSLAGLGPILGDPRCLVWCLAGGCQGWYQVLLGLALYFPSFQRYPVYRLLCRVHIDEQAPDCEDCMGRGRLIGAGCHWLGRLGLRKTTIDEEDYRLESGLREREQSFCICILEENVQLTDRF